VRRQYHAPAPARPIRSAGAVIFSLLLALPGCDAGTQAARGPSVLELDSSRIELPDSVQLITVHLDRARPGEVEPLRVTLRTGDIVRFEADDGAGHAIAFDGALLASDVRRYLEQTGQLRSPPLISRGNAWVVSLAHAPPGEYPYTCVTHNSRGAITVNPR
jgi:plastocyanin